MTLTDLLIPTYRNMMRTLRGLLDKAEAQLGAEAADVPPQIDSRRILRESNEPDRGRRIMSKLFLLLVPAAFAAMTVGAPATASVIVADVADCTKPYTSSRYQEVEQGQIFKVGNTTCRGRWTVFVTLEADGQFGGGKSEASVAIHPVTDRRNEEILRTGPDLCQGKPGALDTKFNHTTVRCSVTRSLSPGNYSELVVRFFTNDTLNPKMETWWTYEPGL